MLPTATVIIPTYNRPEDLTKCLASILDQTIPPFEVIVVDDGNLPAVPLENEMRQRGIRCVYHKKKSPGLTASRNVGIKLATGDIIFFFDDDVVLLPKYLEETLKTFADDATGHLAGVGGIQLNQTPLTLLRRAERIFEVMFLISGLREGQVLPSGFCTDYGRTEFPIRKITDVKFLHGGISAWRRSVFNEFIFSEDFQGYGLGEDKDFSIRVSQKYRLVINPASQLYHYESPQMRYKLFRRGRDYVLDRYYFFKKYVQRRPTQVVFFYYAVVGYLLRRLIHMVLLRDRAELDRARGIVDAVVSIITGRFLWYNIGRTDQASSKPVVTGKLPSE